jgi:transposase
MQDKDAVIKQLAEENKQLREHILLLQEKIARLEKNSSNSSKPPSSDIVNPQPANNKKKKRKIGGQIGHPKYNRALFEADEIDRTVIHKISVEEIRRRGLIPIDKTESVLQQIDLPEKLFNVIEHRVQLYVDLNG